MMIDDSKYEVIGAEKFHQDLHFLRQQAKARPAVYRQLYREVLREVERLRMGTTDGHHALGYEPGKGDLRDCVTAYVRSDAQAKPDYRLVFREIGAAAPGQLPRRELLAIRPRHGSNNVYAHVCARLGRQVTDRQPGLDRFGREGVGGGNGAERQAEMDARRAIAHAWAGQRPLRSSRPLGVGGPRAAGGGGVPVARERPPGARPGPTGWPGRG
ncbi:hypothetical protein ACI2LF_19650 [Kribbella sp. NPDC020789]